MRFKLGEELGSGATAIVYLAEDSLLGRRVALKRLHLHLLHQSEAKSRFAIEAKAVAGLGHENIVRLFDYIEEKGRFMLAFEYIEGGSLSDLLARSSQPLPNLTAIALGLQLFAGLAAAHHKGIVHRDIKPSNILLTQDGVVKLTDFGLAHLADQATLTRTGHLLGTPQFMAPEQAEGALADAKSDVFSAGVVMYRCLSGRYPFQGQTTQETLIRAAKGQVLPIALAQPRLVPGLGEWMSQCLARKPSERPTAFEASVKLKKILENMGATAAPSRLSDFARDAQARVQLENEEICVLLQQWQQREQDQGHRGLAHKLAAIRETFETNPVSQAGHVPHPAQPPRSVWRRPKTLALSVGVLVLTLSAIGYRGWPQLGRPPKTAPSPWLDPIPTQKISTSFQTQPVPAPIFEARPKSLTVEVSGSGPTPSERPSKTKIRPKTMPLVSPSQAQQAQPSNTEMPSQPGLLRILTQPPFARIQVDGQAMGQSPTRPGLVLASGSHRIRLSKEGYRNIDTTFFMPAEDTLQWRLKLLAETWPE